MRYDFSHSQTFLHLPIPILSLNISFFLGEKLKFQEKISSYGDELGKVAAKNPQKNIFEV